MAFFFNDWLERKQSCVSSDLEDEEADVLVTLPTIDVVRKVELTLESSLDDEEMDVVAPLPVINAVKAPGYMNQSSPNWECGSETSFFGTSDFLGGTLEMYQEQQIGDKHQVSKNLVIWTGFKRAMSIRETLKDLRLKDIEGLVAQRTGEWPSLSIKFAVVLTSRKHFKSPEPTFSGFIEFGRNSGDLLSEISSNDSNEDETSWEQESNTSVSNDRLSPMSPQQLSTLAPTIVTPPARSKLFRNRQTYMKDRVYITFVTYKKSIISIALQRGGASFMVQTTLEKSSARMAHSAIDKFAERAILIENSWLTDLAQNRSPSGNACFKNIALHKIVSHFRECFATKEPKELRMPTHVLDARIIDAVIEQGGQRGISAENLILFNNIHYTDVSVLISGTEVAINIRRSSSETEKFPPPSLVGLLNELGLSHLADSHSSTNLFDFARVTSNDARLRRIVSADVSITDSWQNIKSELLARWLVVLCAKSLRSSRIYKSQIKREKPALSSKAQKKFGSVRAENDSLSVHDNCVDALLHIVTADVLPCFRTSEQEDLHLRCLGPSQFITTDPYTTLAEIRKLDPDHPAITPNITSFGTSTFGPQRPVTIASQSYTENCYAGISVWNN
mmetsp:Transcript_6804/g.10089  ORF Transcript_6804/g.10089 Transcript_6804/m.10089 type:complete len:619 (-) Transcript_6804:648-2504(-)